MSSSSSRGRVQPGVSLPQVSAVQAGLCDVVSRAVPAPRLNRQQAVNMLYPTIRDLKAAGFSFEAIARGLSEFGADLAMSSHALLTRLRRFEAVSLKEATGIAAAEDAAHRAKVVADRLARRRLETAVASPSVRKAATPAFGRSVSQVAEQSSSRSARLVSSAMPKAAVVRPVRKEAVQAAAKAAMRAAPKAGRARSAAAPVALSVPVAKGRDRQKSVRR